jgi:hypothetical protein
LKRALYHRPPLYRTSHRQLSAHAASEWEDSVRLRPEQRRQSRHARHRCSSKSFRNCFRRLNVESRLRRQPRPQSRHDRHRSHIPQLRIDTSISVTVRRWTSSATDLCSDGLETAVLALPTYLARMRVPRFVRS